MATLGGGLEEACELNLVEALYGSRNVVGMVTVCMNEQQVDGGMQCSWSVIVDGSTGKGADGRHLGRRQIEIEHKGLGNAGYANELHKAMLI